MDTLVKLIERLIADGAYMIVLSSPAQKGGFVKATVRKDGDIYRCEQLTEKQAFHKNLDGGEIKEFLFSISQNFRQLNAWAGETEYAAKITKKGKLFVSKKESSRAPVPAAGHDKEKQYILKGNSAALPLIDMGVMTAEGRVVKPMYAKFRQINRYLEMIDDVISEDVPKSLNVVDFGCGKSYLTFVVYHFLSRVKNIDVKMTGVDLKEDVIDFCSEVAQKYGYEKLSFVKGDIADYTQSEGADMVISLHACDTATDYVLFNALKWKAKYIFSSPCCQHEVAKQISLGALPVFLGHGVLKERFSSMLTDAVRTEILTACGYTAQLMEFVDLGHTPKNLLIRAVRGGVNADKKRRALEGIKHCLKTFGINPTLCRLAQESGLIDLSGI